jgi:hypothetical protein
VIKIQRTGICEAILQFDHYLGDTSLPHVEGEFIQWLYHSSGFYDRDISGSYFDIDVEAVKSSSVYKDWQILTREAWSESEYLEIMLWQHWRDAYFPNKESEFEEFVDSFACKTVSTQEPKLLNYWDTPEKIFPYLKGKVLVINAMSKLLVSQYDNAHIVYPTMPHFDIVQYTTPYTFFNNGPDKNALETLDRMTDEISQIEFDVALVSCGAYGAMLAHNLYKQGKTSLTLGSGIAKLFAIDPKSTEKHWLTYIPEEFRPVGYMKIEEGRYWLGKNGNN